MLKPHQNFRLWLTTEAHSKFSTVLLQSSLKVTYEVCYALENARMNSGAAHH